MKAKRDEGMESPNIAVYFFSFFRASLNAQRFGFLVKIPNSCSL